MAVTSKTLQVPKILELLGSTIRIALPDLSNEASSYLSSPISAGATSMTMRDNTNLQNGDYIVIGTLGDMQTEVIKVNSSVTYGQSLTVTAPAFSHELDAPVTKVFERGIKIYGATAVGVTGTIIASVAALSGSPSASVPIQWSRPFTEYTMITTDTAYAFYYATHYDGVTESAVSNYIPAAGYSTGSVSKMIRAALDATDTQIDNNKFTWDMMVRWLQLWQNEVTQYSYQDPTSQRWVKKDWNFELAKDSISLIVAQNEDTYDLSLLPDDLKYQDSNKSIITLRIGVFPELTYKSITDFEELMTGRLRTYLTVQANIGDTTVTVYSTAGMSTSGTVTIGADTVSYTGVTATTLTGVPASGTGSITAVHAVNAAVWQGVSQGRPGFYTIYRNSLSMELPPDSTTAGNALKFKYYKVLPALTQASDTTLITFMNTSEPYLCAKIEQRKGNLDKMAAYMLQFKKQMDIECQNDEMPLTQSYTFYDYADIDANLRFDNYGDGDDIFIQS